MADNLTTQSATPATIPASTVIATDDAGAGGHVQIVKLARSTDGSATPITADADGMLVNLGSNNDVTVTGTVAVTQSGTWDEIGINDSGNSITVDNGGTFAVQESGGALTALQLIDDTVYTDGTGTPSKAIGIAGTDGTNPQIIKTDSAGELQVDVVSSALPSGAATAANQSTANTALDAIKTAVEVIDNFISGSKGLVTEDNSAAILTAVQTIDNFISGSRGLVTEDNSAAMLTALQVIDNFISGSRGLVTEDNSAAALTALQLIDDTVATLGTTTYSEATTKGLVIGAVRRDADTTLTDTTNEIAPLQVDANGRLKVEVFSGETLPVSLTSTTVTGTVAVTQSGTWDEVGINDSGNSITVDNGGTFVTQIDGNALTALQLIDDPVATLGTTTYTETSTKGMIVGAVRRDADTTLVDTTNEVGPLQMNAAGQLKVEVFSGETLPVSGTVAVTQSGTWDEVGINDSGNSITVDNGGTFATQATLQAGTAEIGSLLPPDTDVTAHTNYARKYYTNSGAVTDGIVWSPAGGKRWHVVSLYFNVSAAATVTFEDDKAGGDDPVLKGEFAANSGLTINFGEQYPMASGEDAADLLVTTSAGNIYITITGYEI